MYIFLFDKTVVVSIIYEQPSYMLFQLSRHGVNSLDQSIQTRCKFSGPVHKILGTWLQSSFIANFYLSRTDKEDTGIWW